MIALPVVSNGDQAEKRRHEGSAELSLTCLPMPRGVDGLEGEARPLTPLSARSSDRSFENAAAARCTSASVHIDLHDAATFKPYRMCQFTSVLALLL